MTNIEKDIIAYSKQSVEDLDINCPGLSYNGKDGDVYCFTASNPEAWVDFMDISWILDRFVTTARGSYGIYKDGTKITFIKSRRCWEFKKHKKVFAEVTIPKD